MIVKNNKTYGVETKIIESGAPVLQDITITSNGEYTADTSQGYDGLGTVTANVQPNLTALNATANGTYTPTSPVQGYNSVTVNVSNTPAYLTATYMMIDPAYPATAFTILNSTSNIDGWRFKGATTWELPANTIPFTNYGLIEIEFKLVDTSYLALSQFEGCNLIKIELPASVTEIGAGCFTNTNLTEYPDMTYVTTAGSQLFWMCPINSTGLTISDNVTRTYDDYTFNGFDRSFITDKVYVNGTVYIALFNTRNGGNVDFTNGIDGLPIYKWFMYGGHMHYTLNSLKFPSTLQYVSGLAFRDCTITDLYFYGTTPPQCIPFNDDPNLNMWLDSHITNIYVPAEALSAYQNSADFADVASIIQAM